MSESNGFKTGLGQGIGCLGGGFIVLVLLIALGSGDESKNSFENKVNPSASESAETNQVDENVIKSGTWIVGSEVKPGIYRVSGYYAILDENQDILSNDGEYDDSSMTLVVVKETDSYLEVNGEAISIEYLPSYDPILNGATGGTYLVGKDIQPGRYRIEDESYAYAARLDDALEIISNDGNSGNVLVTIKETDFAIQFTGKISPI